ncbi:MAG: ABC transporter substrate-binding protein, partial [Azoarcus sp.]|nr:ABC transporter substrate-binding protein [Azoarcus sp.]
MRLSHSFRSLGVALLLTTSIAGFSSPVAAETLRVGHLPVTGHAKFFVAQDKGFFKAEGLDVELLEFQNSADGLNALISGKLDFAAFGTTAPLAHLAKGAKIGIIAGIMGGDAAIVVKPENASTIKRISDLKGRKIATVRMASGDAVLRGALKDAGLDWKTDVEIFDLKNPVAVIEAVKSGQVDAGVVWGPHDVRAENQGLKIIVRSTDLQPAHPCCRLLVTEASLKQKPEVIEKFLRAILKAQKFGAEHPKET